MSKKSGLFSGFVVGSVIGGVGAYLLMPKAKVLKEQLVEQVEAVDDEVAKENLGQIVNYFKEGTQNILTDLKIKKQVRKDEAISFIQAFEDETQSIAQALEANEIADIELNVDELIKDETK